MIPPPQLQFFTRINHVPRFTLGPDTAARSERYISSLERTDLGVPLEVEFEETPSSGAVGDSIDRNVSAPGAVYNIKIWSINGASFSSDPLVAATNLLFNTGKEIASIDIVHYASSLASLREDTLRVLLFVRKLFQNQFFENILMGNNFSKLI